jgi:hypothetical protein
MSIVRADKRDRTAPVPEENEVVIFRCFFKAGLRFPLNKFVVEVLKIYQIFLQCWGPSSSEGPQKHDLPMFLEYNT